MTPKQKRFVAEYLVDLNATAAAKRAGYSPKTAYAIGHELLKKPEIAAAISEVHAKNIRAANVDAQRVLSELYRLATSDLRRCFSKSGDLLPVDEWPDEVAAAVAGVEVVRRKGDDDEPEYIHKIKLWDKNTALTNLAKHFGLLRDLVEHSGPGGGPIRIDDLTTLSDEELAERAQALLAKLGKA